MKFEHVKIPRMGVKNIYLGIVSVIIEVFDKHQH